MKTMFSMSSYCELCGSTELREVLFHHIQKHRRHNHSKLKTAMPAMYPTVNYVFQPNSEKPFFTTYKNIVKA